MQTFDLAYYSTLYLKKLSISFAIFSKYCVSEGSVEHEFRNIGAVL